METRKLSVIMFTDIVGYSRKVQADEDHALKLLTIHNEILQKQIDASGGNTVKTIGDSFMVDFDSAFSAVNCAAAIQQDLTAHNANAADELRIDVRVGIHAGDVIYRDGDVFGDGVNIASRVEGEAGGGEVFVSHDVFSITYGKLDFGYKDIGTRDLKNISRPVHIYELLWDQVRAGEEDAEPPRGPRLSQKRTIRLVVGMAAAIAIVVALAVFTQPDRDESILSDDGRPSLAVLAFSDQTADEHMGRIEIARIIQFAVTQKFYEFPHVRLVSPVRLGRAIKDLGLDAGQVAKDIPLAEEVAREANSRLVVTGSLTRLGGRFILTASLHDVVGEGRLLANRRFEAADEGEILGSLIDPVCDDFQRTIAADFDIAVADEFVVAGIGVLTTHSLEALSHYVKGIDLFRSGDLMGGGAELDRATEIDTSFALAYSEAACAYSFAKNDSLQAIAAANAARHRDRLDGISKEALIFKGNYGWAQYYTSKSEKDLEYARVNYKSVTELYPDDRDGYHYYGPSHQL